MSTKEDVPTHAKDLDSKEALGALGSSLALADAIGSILSQVALGQAQADQTTTQLGELYKTNLWLARMPVPRIVAKNIEIEMKVIFTQGTAPLSIVDHETTIDYETSAVANQPQEVHIRFPDNVHSDLSNVSTIKFSLEPSHLRLVKVDDDTLLIP